MYPQLNNPNEAAYIAVAMAYLPKGMMGLMICAMLGATVSCMDTGLNRNAGIFVRNFYLPILRPKAGEGELVLVSRMTTMLLGCLIILCSLNITKLQTVGIFELVQWMGSMVAFPMTIPLALVMLTRKAAPWAAWSTTLVGFTTSITIATFLNPAWFSGVIGRELLGAEVNYWVASIGVLANLVTCSSWFLLSMLWWKRIPEKRRREIEEFNTRMRLPIAPEECAGRTPDYKQGHLMGGVAMGFGSFILLMTLIPNPLGGRFAFLFCGCVVLGIGALLRRASHRTRVAEGLPRI
jgi:Na+/proline symporter